MSYQIGLTGAQGTGKSTLARAVVARLEAEGIGDIESCFGLGEGIVGAGLVTGARAGPETVRLFARTHIAREASEGGVVRVFDRALLDTLAYAEVLECLPPDE